MLYPLSKVCPSSSYVLSIYICRCSLHFRPSDCRTSAPSITDKSGDKANILALSYSVAVVADNGATHGVYHF